MESFPLSTKSLGIAVAVACAAGSIVYASRRERRPPLPPGPKGLPLVGNLNDLPKPGKLEAHHWLEHRELYGPISSVTVLGQTIVIINDAKLAFELLEKRSAKHSSRPKQVFAGELLGWENSLGLSPYNDAFRTHRKNMSRLIGSKTAAARYSRLQEAEAGHFLLHVLDDPDGLLEHIRRESGAVILKIGYGYTAEPFKSDPFIDMAGEAMDNFNKAAVPGAFVVDVMPFLKYLPDWFPGTVWKQTAKSWAAQLRDVTEKPYAFVKHQLASGKDDASFLARLLETGGSSAEENWINKWSAASLYTAGADTIVSSLAFFFLAMTIYPEVQTKAQEEIDRVVGRDRLPNMADRENLPYVEAVVKEVLRWYPVAPMALPHTSVQDDMCEGYFIPSGSMLLANVWHFTHDPAHYQDPSAFKPERFIPAESGRGPEPDPHQFAFGFGRRICPGRILADNALYLTIAQSLAVFDVTKALDEEGREIEPQVKATPGVISHPEPFETRIAPRSSHHEKLIRRIIETHPWEESDAKLLESMES